MNYPTNSDDVIDSRDVIKAIEELEAEALADAHFECDVCGTIGTVDDLCEDGEPCPDEECSGTCHRLPDDEDWPELVALKKLAEEGEDYAADWRFGETLIRDSYFETYAQQFAEDIGRIDGREYDWPLDCIDWKQAAEELQMDYTSIDFDGVTYWIR